jgi:hypothetical protein
VLNFRTWTPGDAVLWPAGKLVRALWRVPKLGPAISKRRTVARLGWQANRLSPTEVLEAVGDRITDVKIVRSPKRRSFAIPGTSDLSFEGVHPSHWWLVAKVV